VTTPNLSLTANGERWSRFVPLTKFDEETGIGYGTLALEELDKANEIMDYAESKPHFLAWSESIQKASNGQSVGNLRAMHQLRAAGKFTKVTFDDERKAVDVEFEVVDAEDKKKCAKGVYTGLSVGGTYVKTWDDPTIEKAKRYIARPSEGSLVDNPCMTNATFVYRKADGTEELRKFVGRQPRQVWACDAAEGCEHEQKAEAASCPGIVKGNAELPELVKAALTKAASPDAVKKCLFQIAQLAGALQSVGWVHSAEEYEAAAEADGSTVPDKIKAGITALFEALSAMVDEEAAEWASEEGLAMAVTSTLEKINAKPQRLRELLSKRAETEDDDMKPEEFTKIIGESNAELKKTFADELGKVSGRIGEVEKSFTDKLAAVTADVETIKKAVPAPTSVAANLHAVTKGADTVDETGKPPKAEKDMTAVELTKASFQNRIAVA